MDPGQGFQTFEDRMKAKGVSPSFIAILIQIFQSLIANCPAPTPAGLKRGRRRPRVAIAVKRQMDDVSWQEAYHLTDVSFAVHDAATDPECQCFIDCCNDCCATPTP